MFSYNFIFQDLGFMSIIDCHHRGIAPMHIEAAKNTTSVLWPLCLCEKLIIHA